ncbi:hypothetical protein SCHPADRAFT_942033 [Schizopora paradoxa]|uniref:Uncharacterized protein n=1 Tax=Schizopora paradoxa TaxID=27342 RepID=A0A0H2RPU0_9AGAM|nr:hypothetical protein SCHPADRAFT_942033 [Schizopora paradoxa]
MDNFKQLALANGKAPRLWIAQPDFRGTFGILSLCLSTLLICVWNAIHPDIPMRRFSTTRKLFVAFMWMVVAIFAPELLLFIAFNQRLAATKVLKLASKTFSAPPSKSAGEGDDTDLSERNVGKRKHPLTIVHGFYSAMGGFVFDFLDEEGQLDGPTFLPPGQTRMCISASGVQFLLRHDPDLIPDISEYSITERSKGSSFAKAVLVAQLAWFCANCISRLAQHLPLSLLEIATVAHGLCGMITYALWWSKPLNVADPTPIRGKRAREACALMQVCSMKHLYLAGGIMSIHLSAELDYLTTLPPNDEVEDKKGVTSIPPLSELPSVEGQIDSIVEGPVSLVPEKQSLGVVGLSPKQYVSPGVLVETSIELKAQILYRILRNDIPWHARRRMHNQPVHLTPLDVKRWLMASNAMRRYGVDLKSLADEIPSQQPHVMPKATMQASSDSKAKSLVGIVTTNAATVLLTVAFGLPHFLGWNAVFPSPRERHIWHAATITVTSWGVALGILAAIGLSVRWWFGASPWDRRGETAFVACGAVVYNTASGYLLVESIVQLFFLPREAYNLPSWSNYWPHFG